MPGGIAEAPFTQNNESMSALSSADFPFKEHRIIVPYYEDTEVAIPPSFACSCGNCEAGHEAYNCHHNAFEERHYKDPPGVRLEASRLLISLFRGTPFNRFYTPNCTHLAIQPTGLERAKRPKLYVIGQYMGETAILANIDRTVHLTDPWLSHKYDTWQRDIGFSSREIKRKKQADWQSREQSIEQLGSISAIPEEVVTAVLVYSAPKIAAERLAANPDQALLAPASWPKRRLRALVARSIGLRSESREALQTGVDEVELGA